VRFFGLVAGDFLPGPMLANVAELRRYERPRPFPFATFSGVAPGHVTICEMCTTTLPYF
jgi:hypothetical protein